MSTNEQFTNKHREHKSIADIHLSSFHFGEEINNAVNKVFHKNKSKKS